MDASAPLTPVPMTTGADFSGGPQAYCPYLNPLPSLGQSPPFGYRFSQATASSSSGDNGSSNQWQRQSHLQHSYHYTQSHSQFSTRSSFTYMSNMSSSRASSMQQHPSSYGGTVAASAAPASASSSAQSNPFPQPSPMPNTMEQPAGGFMATRILPVPHPVPFPNHVHTGGQGQWPWAPSNPPWTTQQQPQAQSQSQPQSQPQSQLQSPPQVDLQNPGSQGQQEHTHRRPSAFPLDSPRLSFNPPRHTDPSQNQQRLQQQQQHQQQQTGRSTSPGPMQLDFHHQIPPSVMSAHHSNTEQSRPPRQQQDQPRPPAGRGGGSVTNPLSPVSRFGLSQRTDPTARGTPPSSFSLQPESSEPQPAPRARTTQSRPASLLSSGTTPSPPLEARRRTYNAGRHRFSRVPPPGPSPGADMDFDSAPARFIEALAAHRNVAWRAGDTNALRHHQILRGQAMIKRAAKSVLASLKSVDMATLSKEDRSCCICYNEFGVPNAEGVNEAPLQLPNCKHIFGDHCIKKWFEEKDTCPYCRDKIPSEKIGFGGEGAAAMLREPSAEVVLAVLPSSSDEARELLPARRSPPEDSSDVSRRRTRARHNTLRNTHSGRHQPSQSGSSSASASRSHHHTRSRGTPMPAPASTADSSAVSPLPPLPPVHPHRVAAAASTASPPPPPSSAAASTGQQPQHPHPLEPSVSPYHTFPAQNSRRLPHFHGLPPDFGAFGSGTYPQGFEAYSESVQDPPMYMNYYPSA